MIDCVSCVCGKTGINRLVVPFISTKSFQGGDGMKSIFRKTVFIALILAVLTVSHVLAQSGGPVKLRFLSHEKSLEAEHTKIIAAFEAANPGIKVAIEYVSPGNIVGYVQKVDTMILAGEKFDIGYNTIKHDMVKRAEEGMLYPMDSFFKKEGTTYDAEYLIEGEVNDDHYGFPCDVKSWIVFINKNALKEAGLPVPPLDWTWDDYRMYAKKLTKGEGASKRYGSFMANVWDHFFNFPLYNAKKGTPYVNEKNQFDPNRPELWSFLEYRKTLEDVDKTQMPSADNVTLNMLAIDALIPQKAAMAPFGTWMIADIKKTQQYPHDFVTTFAALPRASKDAPAGRTYTENRWWWVPKTSAHPEEAYKFVRFYTTVGMTMKGAGFSASRKNPARDEIIKIMTADNASGLYDIDALKAVLKNPKWTDNAWDYSPSWIGEMASLRVETSNAYLTGGATLEQTKKLFASEGQKIFERNTKKK